ncbi:MAG TPA: anti-sigma factor domain-containing protein, partial [Clostridium sp.]|nr:anti-sigma factor domain-containing protein [Clostridium sp.]
MKYKGIVIRLTKNKAIVTTEDFQCYYIKRSPIIFVGKEVEFTNKEIIEKTHTLTKWALSVACAIFLITSFIYFTGIIDIDNILYSPQVFAYVSIDINPSFEMEIDYEGRVLNLVPLDDDARFILNNIKFDKVNISKVIDNIIGELKAKDDISEKRKEHILISSTLNWKNQESDDSAPEKRQKLDIIMDGIKNDIEGSYKADVYLLQGDIKQREDAKSEGISTGRYIVYKSLEKDLSIEDVKKATVADIIENLESGKLEVMATTSPTPTPTPTQMLTTPPIQTPRETPTPMTSTQQSSNTLSNRPSNTSSNTSNNTPTSTQTPIPTPEPIDLMYRRFESSNYRGYFIRSESFRAGISSYVAPVEDSI